MNRSTPRQRRLSRPLPDNIEHGRSTYVNWGCRCDICKQGQSQYMKDYRKTLKEKAA